jgi:hypothetical protein
MAFGEYLTGRVMAEERPKTISFREGEFLTAAEGGEVVRASPSSIVVVAGMARSGKTTLVGELYGLFHKGPFAGFRFSGSRTLPGFERRCHLARLYSDREIPDTERTGFSENHDLLHLRLADAHAVQHDLLFSDIYGEAFRLASDSVEECRKLAIFKRADHVVVLVDGKRAIDKRERQGAFSAADSLLRLCLDCEMLNDRSNVQIVLTKWDEVAGHGDKFIQEKLRWLVDRHRNKLATLTTHRAALRSTGVIKAGYGVAELLHSWVTIRNRFHPSLAAIDKQYYSEFDRLDATWKMAKSRSRHA